MEKNDLLKYMPQLDALRFLAVLSVINFHWMSNFEIPIDLSFGPYRIPLLFAISGFLTTYILLKEKERGSSISNKVKNFYIGRGLRILPIYYLLLLIMIKLNDGFVIHYFPFFALLLSNFATISHEVYTINTWHLWTISVLEQFYLIFPWLLLYCNPKYELRLGVLIVVAGFLFNVYVDLSDQGFLKRITLSAFDSLGIGIVIGVLKFRGSSVLNKFSTHASLFACISLIFCYLSSRISIRWVSSIIYFSTTSLFCFFLIIKSSIGFEGIVKKFLEFPLFLFLGRLTYGLYIYHMVTPYLLLRILDNTGLMITSKYSLYFLSLLLLLIITIISWYAIERPIMRLRTKYPNRKKERSLMDITI